MIIIVKVYSIILEANILLWRHYSRFQYSFIEVNQVTVGINDETDKCNAESIFIEEDVWVRTKKCYRYLKQ